MFHHRDPTLNRVGQHRRGFTLVELIAVSVIIGLLSVTAMISMSSTASARERAAARHLARDLRFAREWAMTTGLQTWLSFSLSSHSWSVLVDSRFLPGRSSALALTDPATGNAMVTRINVDDYAGVRLMAVSVPGGGSEFGFDWLGRSENTAGTALTSDVTITIGSAPAVRVLAGTGAVEGP
ncbi:MAG: type II secretion system protein [Planctomycetota bacterium]|nr:type II secretion system protein [Planctomycetota bacterium]